MDIKQYISFPPDKVGCFFQAINGISLLVSIIGVFANTNLFWKSVALTFFLICVGVFYYFFVHNKNQITLLILVII